MSRYAEKTTVPVSRSKAEIEDILNRYGCEGFMSGWQGNQALIAFQVGDRQVKFILPMPDKQDTEFWTTAHGRRGSEDAAFKSWEQSFRQRWRSLALAIKAKLEAVECGIVTFDQEFLAHIVSSSGQTVGQEIIPMLNENTVPRLELGV